MAKKKISFAVMNMLLKGTSSAIQNALLLLDSDTFTLNEISYKADKVDLSDNGIVEAGLVFNTFLEKYITPDDIAISKNTDIKFIGLGNGGNGNRTDGSYVFYKGFGEASISECYQFSRINPQMEEFEAQWGVVEKVHNSFMNHEWVYEYDDYSSGGRCQWCFNGKKELALIKKWESNDIEDSINGSENKKAPLKNNSKATDYSIIVEEVSNIDFDSSAFVLAGFKVPEEESIKADIQQRCGTIKASINDKVNYLIVPDGEIKTNAKIKKAVELQKQGVSITIISISECRKHMCLRDEELLGIEGARFAWEYRFSVKDNEITLLKYIGKEKRVIIPDFIGKYQVLLAENCFKYNSNLEEIEIPKGVTVIPQYLCSKCANLSSVIISEGVQIIKKGAFDSCAALKEINFPSTTTTIESEAFNNCEGISSIFIPSGVTSIGAAFTACNNITEMVVDEGNNAYDSRNNCNAIIESATNMLVSGCKTTAIPETASKIGPKAFCGLSSLLSIEIPEGVAEIADEAFFGCSKLTDISFPKTLIRIGKLGFSRCSGISSIILPSEVSEVGENAFVNCDNLHEITISEKLKFCEEDFLDEWKIKKVYGSKNSVAEKIAKRKKAEYIEI